MDEEKLPCFGSHKVILVEGSKEDDSISFSINPECEECPQFRACRRRGPLKKFQDITRTKWLQF